MKTTNAGSMQKRIEALKRGEVAAVVLMEPWISVAQKEGLRILIESHSTRSEAASDEVDGPTLAAMFRAQARAVETDREGPDAVRPLPGRGNRRAARGEGLPDVAAAARAAAALHARAVGGYLQLDGQVEHDRAGRDLREHRRQPRLEVTKHSRTHGFTDIDGLQRTLLRCSMTMRELRDIRRIVVNSSFAFISSAASPRTASSTCRPRPACGRDRSAGSSRPRAVTATFVLLGT